MAFWTNLLRRGPSPVVFSPNRNYLGAYDDSPIRRWLQAQTVADLWYSQPHLRTVVSFLARNIAQTGIQVFARLSDDSRERDRTSALARALQDPGDGFTQYDLIYALVGDLALYDRAYWLLWWEGDTPRLRRLPPPWVTVNREESPFKVDGYAVAYGADQLELPAEDVLAFTGYSPTSHNVGSPVIESLRATIEEQIEATEYRSQVWRRGGRASSVIERPADAPQWSDAARESFREDWYSKFTGKGSKAGGTPILEDGMTLKRIDFSAHDQQFIEGAKLALATVASSFHVNPTMIGQLENANYSNVREFRRMLYGDTLGPWLAQIEARINTFLVPMLDLDPLVTYSEFNIEAKLKGSFEEQNAAMQTAVGRPWMTADEARAKLNLPALGGDAAELITPLNVTAGGQASPTDSGSQNRVDGTSSLPPHRGRRAIAAPAKADEPDDDPEDDPDRDEIAKTLRRFFQRQGAITTSRLGAGGDWWDEERWNRELRADLTEVASEIASRIGSEKSTALGYPDAYSADQTLEFLEAVAERYALNVNETTKAQIDAVLEDDDADPADVFTQAEDSRALGIATGLGTFVAGFASTEAGRQIARAEDVRVTKTWLTGRNPRGSHKALNGQTVPIDAPFSNGLQWPAESGPAAETAGCNCSVEVEIP